MTGLAASALHRRQTSSRSVYGLIPARALRIRVLIGLGGTAIDGLLGQNAGITRVRGTWQTYRGIPLMPTFHPSYVLRNQSAAVKRQVWEDMLQVMEKLQMEITDKQRAFFRKPSA